MDEWITEPNLGTRSGVHLMRICAIRGVGTVCIVGIHMHVVFTHMGKRALYSLNNCVLASSALMQCVFLCVHGYATLCCFDHM